MRESTQTHTHSKDREVKGNVVENSPKKGKLGNQKKRRKKGKRRKNKLRETSFSKER